MSLNKRLMSSAPAFVASENFNTVLYTGNATDDTAITGVGFQPDLVWLKERSAVENHNLTDSTRGTNKILNTNSTNAEVTSTSRIKSFDADGFTLGDNNETNDNNVTYVAWCWKAGGGTTASNTDGNITTTVQVNTDAGFSIVTGTTPSSTANTDHAGHGLGVAPDLIIMKPLVVENWYVYHSAMGTGSIMRLDTTAAKQTGVAGIFSAVNSTTFRTNYTGTGSQAFVAYCFKSIDGFSKFGSYTGNGSDNGPIVETGFEPAFIMFKRTDSADSWVMHDNARSTSNPRKEYLLAQGSNVEATDLNGIDFLSNGFQILDDYAYYNASGGTYIYMAFAADPDTEAPTLASSFNVETWTGTGSARSITGFGFSPNLAWIKIRTQSYDHNLIDTIRGVNKQVRSNRDIAEVTNATLITSFDSDGVSLGTGSDVNKSGDSFVGWFWKADDNEPTLTEQGATDSDTILTYRFENDNTDDSTGTYNGTASNITFTSTGPLGNSVEFNGSSSQIVNSSFTRTQNYTVSLWLNTDTSSGERMAIALNWSAGTGRVAIGIKDGGIKYQDGNSGWLTILSSVSTDTWYHVAITYDHSSTTAKAYLNGSEVVSTSVTIAVPSTGGGLYLGQFGSSAGYWDGEVSRVRIYNSALGSSDITALYNESIKSIVSVNANAGFSIVKYDGTGVDMKVPHGLSAAPELLIIKGLETINDWAVLHTDGTDNNFLQLNSSAAESGDGSVFGSTFARPTATVFTVGNTGESGTDDKSYIAYCFHSVTGYSKIGNYSGNGSSGRLIDIGFQADWVMIKTTNATSNWFVLDSVRGGTKDLRPNASNAEETRTNGVTFVTDGFELDDTSVGFNDSSTEYIYAAFKMNFSAEATSGKMVFLVVAGGAGGSSNGGGGGAGGLRTSYGSTSGGGASAESDITLGSVTYTITIGAGGAAQTTYQDRGLAGVASSIAATGLTTISTVGGGGGGSNNTPDGIAGGSGGGAGTTPSGGGNTGGAGTANQGYAGGDTTANGHPYAGAGGGGAAAAAANVSSTPGVGGAGLHINILQSSVAETPYYAGGGGGTGGTQGAAGGLGGVGGGGQGGTGSSGADGVAATANTGGGGGSSGDAGDSGAGGSGIVILRLLTADYSGSTTGSPTVTTAGTETILKYTSSGTYVHS
jgi:hypothetical protein